MNRTQVEWTSDRAAAAIRPVRPADLPALRDFFAALSPQARYLRFFAPVTPGPTLLDLLSGGAGTTDAVVATRGAIIIGHAMAADRGGPCDSRMTDIGVVVADAWQGEGIGSALVRALITSAQARGVTSVAMDVLPGNHKALAMIKGHWPEAHTGWSRDYGTIGVQLPMAGVLASLRPRVAVPRQARRTFGMALPYLVATWMLSGFCLSLGPSLAAQVLRSPDLLWAGW
jgi:ribosomal protein S18 acetylase RimI-like enzyme